jgi:hypothetical protein
VPDVYVVVVRNNVVCAIERSTAAAPVSIPQTPLEVATELATNNRVNGCIDGRYRFDDTQRAKIFAALCLEFTRAVVERRLAAIEALPVGRAEYRADDDRDANGTTPLAG